jgi:hypothetical protein
MLLGGWVEMVSTGVSCLLTGVLALWKKFHLFAGFGLAFGTMSMVLDLVASIEGRLWITGLGSDIFLSRGLMAGWEGKWKLSLRSELLIELDLLSKADLREERLLEKFESAKRFLASSSFTAVAVPGRSKVWSGLVKPETGLLTDWAGAVPGLRSSEGRSILTTGAVGSPLPRSVIGLSLSVTNSSTPDVRLLPKLFFRLEGNVLWPLSMLEDRRSTLLLVAPLVVLPLRPRTPLPATGGGFRNLVGAGFSFPGACVSVLRLKSANRDWGDGAVFCLSKSLGSGVTPLENEETDAPGPAVGLGEGFLDSDLRGSPNLGRFDSIEGWGDVIFLDSLKLCLLCRDVGRLLMLLWMIGEVWLKFMSGVLCLLGRTGLWGGIMEDFNGAAFAKWENSGYSYSFGFSGAMTLTRFVGDITRGPLFILELMVVFWSDLRGSPVPVGFPALPSSLARTVEPDELDDWRPTSAPEVCVAVFSAVTCLLTGGRVCTGLSCLGWEYVRDVIAGE